MPRAAGTCVRRCRTPRDTRRTGAGSAVLGVPPGGAPRRPLPSYEEPQVASSDPRGARCARGVPCARGARSRPAAPAARREKSRRSMRIASLSCMRRDTAAAGVSWWRKKSSTRRRGRPDRRAQVPARRARLDVASVPDELPAQPAAQRVVELVAARGSPGQEVGAGDQPDGAEPPPRAPSASRSYERPARAEDAEAADGDAAVGGAAARPEAEASVALSSPTNVRRNVRPTATRSSRAPPTRACREAPGSRARASARSHAGASGAPYQRTTAPDEDRGDADGRRPARVNVTRYHAVAGSGWFASSRLRGIRGTRRTHAAHSRCGDLGELPEDHLPRRAPAAWRARDRRSARPARRRRAALQGSPHEGAEEEPRAREDERRHGARRRRRAENDERGDAARRTPRARGARGFRRASVRGASRGRPGERRRRPDGGALPRAPAIARTTAWSNDEENGRGVGGARARARANTAGGRAGGERRLDARRTTAAFACGAI